MPKWRGPTGRSGRAADEGAVLEGYTKRARRVLIVAQYEASQFGSTSIETEHLLLALLRIEKGLASRILARSHLSPATIRKEILERAGFRTVSFSNKPFSAETIRVLQFAAEEADRLRHNRIGTEHLLLGILSEPDSVAATRLTARGITSNGVRDALAQMADAFPDSSSIDLPLSAQSAAPIADPVFHFVGSTGCGNVFLYAWNAPRSEFLTAYIDIKKLGFGPGAHVIDIASAGDAVALGVDVYRDPELIFLRYCSDVGPFAKAPARWRAVAGTATLTIGDPGGVPGVQPGLCKATLRVDGLTIVGPDGRKLSASAPVVLSGAVGRVAGDSGRCSNSSRKIP